ncbi:hypothetical protein HRbin08_01148 [bacterium HR08]|nr:hypothetical protein HRbin08_01148 [bacterium HR08]
MRGEYGEIMRFLLHFRERFPSEEEFRAFLTEEVRQFVKDAREYDIVLSILPECLKPRSAFVGEGRRGRF